MKRIIKSPAFWIVIIEIVAVLIFLSLGFQIIYPPQFENSWAAIGAIGEWVGAAVGLLIPIAVVIIQHRLEKDKREISNANQILLKDLNDFKQKYEPIIKRFSTTSVNDATNTPNIGATQSSIQPQELSDEQLKKKALKFINISMLAKTSKIADHLGVSKEKAFDLLVEMFRHDRTISAGGQIREERIDQIVWQPKSR